MEALTFWQTVGTDFFNALFTALLVAGIAALGTLWFQTRADSLRQAREQDFQTRSALRTKYSELLSAQRHCRQMSMELAYSRAASSKEGLAAARAAHDTFLDAYHEISLDADKGMWKALGSLRESLDLLLYHAQLHNTERCQQLFQSARNARRNLERSFRRALKHESLQEEFQVGDLSDWKKASDETRGTFWVD